MSLTPFVSKEQIQGKKALKAFVAHYKNLMKSPLKNPYDDTSDAWEWGAICWINGAVFSKYEYTSKRKISAESVLDQGSLVSFQAAAMHFWLTTKPSKEHLRHFVMALRTLEFILRKRSVNNVADFSTLTVGDLNNAVKQVQLDKNTRRFEKSKLVIKMLGKLNIVQSQALLKWENPIKSEQNKTSLERKSLTAVEKLPDIRAVIAVADYFRGQPWLTMGDSPDDLDADDKNILVSSVLAILMMLPARIGEVMEQLSVNCLHEELLEGKTVLGIDWYAQKTDMNHIKWVPHTINGEFENTVCEAVARLKHITEPARQVFRTWDSECKEFDQSAYDEAVENNWLPKLWPWFSKENGVRYSDALIVSIEHQYNTKRTNNYRVAKQINNTSFGDYLSGGERARSFFERIGHTELELTSGDFNTHGFRHMVNTAARLGGMSEFDLNWWSHRKTMGEVYDQRTFEQNKNLIATGSIDGRELSSKELLEQINHAIPLTRKALGLKFEIVPNGHGGFTFQHPLGRCTHNYVEGPCLRNVNCIECPENLHCKGDKRTLKNLMEELEKINLFIQMAIRDDDQFNLKRLKMRHEIVDSLVHLLGDESPLMDGDLVILSPEEAPKAGTVERAKAAAEILNHENHIKLTHKEACKQIGLTRALPLLEDVEAKKKVEEEIQLDDFLLAYEDDDE